MTLGEVYLRGILRPPPTGFIPEVIPHPFQKSFSYYITKKFIPKHWFLAVGFGFTLTMYGVLDRLRDSGQVASYDEAIKAGKAPFTAGGH